MQIDKVVLRSILSTLAAIAVLFVGLMLTLILVFPSTMMGFTYDMGMDGASVYFAKSAYKRSGEVYYIAFATETAIGAKDVEAIEECAVELVENEDFGEYCQLQDEKLKANDGTYKNYIYSNLCLVVYDSKGGEVAARIAVEGAGNSFAKGNPISTVLVYAMTKSDRTTVETLYTAMQSITPTDEAQKANLNEMSAFASSYLNENV